MKLDEATNNSSLITWGLLILSSVFFLLNIDFESTGDTVYYANIIDTLRFDRLTAHQGYYAIGLVFSTLCGSITGLSTDQSLAVMSALFGAGALVIAYRLFRYYLESESDALIATLMLFIGHRFYENATSAEIYIVQAFFIWSAYLLYEKTRFYSAGLSIAIALWITPLTVFFGLWFIAVMILRRFSILSLVKMSIPVLLIYLPFLFFFYHELLWGDRGLIVADSRRQLDFAEGIQNFVVYQFKHYTFLNLLLLPALFTLRKQKYILLTSLAAALPNLYVISNLRSEDNVFILTLDVFFVMWFIFGWRELKKRSLGWIAIILLLAHLSVFLFTERPFLNDSHLDYDEEMKTIAEIVQQAEDPILFTDWTRRMAFVYFNREEASFPLEQGRWFDMVFDIGGFTKRRVSRENFSHYKTVFVLESWKYSTHSILFLDKETIEQRYEQNSRRRKLERYLDIECQPIREGMFTLYQCR